MNEKEYVVAVEGHYPRAQIELQLQNEEARASEFVSLEIGQDDDGNDVNLVTFRERDTRPTPRLQLAVVPLGTEVPAGKTRLWEGEALVDGSTQEAAVYR